MSPRKEKSVTGCFERNAVVSDGLIVDGRYPHAFAVTMNPSIPDDWSTKDPKDVKPTQKDATQTPQLRTDELGGLMFPDHNIKVGDHNDEGIFSKGSYRKVMCRRAFIKRTEAEGIPRDEFYKGPSEELDDWKEARQKHPCFLKLTQWPVGDTIPSKWLRQVRTRKKNKGGTSSDQKESRNSQYPTYLLQSEDGMDLRGMLYFQPCDCEKCFCGGVLASVACGFLNNNNLSSTQWKSLLKILPSLSELWKELEATAFPANGKCAKGKELMVLFDRCFLQVYSTSYNQHYAILGLDYQAYRDSDACSPGPMPMCRNALMEWFPDSMKNFMAHCVDFNCNPDSKGYPAYEFGTRRLNDYYFKQGRTQHYINVCFCVFHAHHASLQRKTGVLARYEDPMPPPPELVEFHKIWMEGKVYPLSKSLRFVTKSLSDVMGAVRNMVGLSNSAPVKPRDKNRLTEVKYILADHQYKYAHPGVAKNDDDWTFLETNGIEFGTFSDADVQPSGNDLVFGRMEELSLKHHGDMLRVETPSELLGKLSRYVRGEVPALPSKGVRFGNVEMELFAPGIPTLWRATGKPTGFSAENDGIHNLFGNTKVAKDVGEEEFANDMEELRDHVLEVAFHQFGDKKFASGNCKCYIKAHFVQGRFDTDFVYTSLPLTLCSVGCLSSLARMSMGRKEAYSNVRSCLVKIPLGRYGLWSRYFPRKYDNKGVLVCENSGTTIAIPSSIPLEFGQLTDIDGNPHVVFVVIAISDDVAEGAKVLNVVDLDKVTQRFYPQLDEVIGHGSNGGYDANCKLCEELESSFTLMKAREYRGLKDNGEEDGDTAEDGTPAKTKPKTKGKKRKSCGDDPDKVTEVGGETVQGKSREKVKEELMKGHRFADFASPVYNALVTALVNPQMLQSK